MADLGSHRRDWMVEQAAAAGHALDALLPPQAARALYEPTRDDAGNVMAPLITVTPQTADELAADYDLPSAGITRLMVERAGDRLVGSLQLTVARTFPLDDSASRAPAKLNISLRDITGIHFDSDDAQGVTLRTGPEGVSIGIGTRGEVRAGTGEVFIEDFQWHLSTAGRRADAVTPRRGRLRLPPRLRGASPPRRRLRPNALGAATLLYCAMLEIRSVRVSHHAAKVPVGDLARTFEGAGAAILTAGAEPRHRRRQAAFRRLIETWVLRGGPSLAPWFAETLQTMVHGLDFAPELPEAPAPTPDTAAAALPPAAELRLAKYTAEYTDDDPGHPFHSDAAAVVLLAVPPAPAGAWQLYGRRATPTRFRLRTPAFGGPTTPGGAARLFTLADSALAITTSSPWDDAPPPRA